jgi:hypothetical protein
MNLAEVEKGRKLNSGYVLGTGLAMEPLVG